MISGVEKSSKMKVVGIIPARYHSTRLPGKPLRRLAGKILIQRVYENAARCRLLDDLLVATDDERIRDAVQEFGGKAVMTPADLPSGSDRCAFVAQTLEAEIIADIQGDEPFLDIGVLEQAIRLLRSDPEVNIVTAARTGITSEELADPNVVKVLLDKNRNAL
ncbi:MAG TPA: 3-deoxy-manno-octulosonate cytidylyltransferase, partial [Candidatus Marinimicrobia bacterium]|nr:3-deoxy-manno-octulosonate cytidylyltransferase [Candidatus Neomarinimicrobiota bacterium]